MSQSEELVRKVVVTGPESSGKTTLSKALAANHQTVWVPEYARTWGEQLDRPFQAEDIPLIAQQQQQWEIEAAAKAVHWLFCDTGPVVLRVWEEVKFGQQSKVVEDWLQTSDYFLFLLCRPDLPWEADPLREDRDNRDQLFNHYQVVLERYSLPYVIIEGEDRLGKAMAPLI